MKITVVIPAYQAAATIQRAISSVLAQTYPDFEVVVVDDGSSDETRNIIRSISDERIHLLTHSINKGAAAARNTGIQAAHGELVTFLDSDDAWMPQKLLEQVAFMESHLEFGASVTSYWYETEEGPSLQILSRPKSWLKEFSKGCAVAAGTTLIVRKTCYEEVGFYDENMPRHEDFDWLLRFVQKYDLGVIRSPLATVYRSGQASGEKIGRANEMLVERYKTLFYSLGSFKGSQAIGKRWLETSIHYFMFGNKQLGYAYLMRTVKENPFQRLTMYLRVVDYILGIPIFLTFKKIIFIILHFFKSKKKYST